MYTSESFISHLENEDEIEDFAANLIKFMRDNFDSELYELEEDCL